MIIGLLLIKKFLQIIVIIHLCDLAVFYDNSEMINRFAIYEEGIMKIVSDEEPIWFIDWKNGKYKNKP